METKGSFGEVYKNIEYYDADLDGYLENLAQDDPWACDAEIARRIANLDEAANVRLLDSEEIEKRIEEKMWDLVELETAVGTFTGRVIDVKIQDFRDAVITILPNDADLTADKITVIDYDLKDFFVDPQLPN